MSRRKKQRYRRVVVSGSKEKTGGEERKSIFEFAAEWKSRHPVFVFLLIFGVLMGLFYAFVTFTPFYKKHFLFSYLPFNAKVSGAVLSLLGQDITVAGRTISSPRFSVEVYSGCDGVEPIALFVCAVLAFPAPFLRKIPGIIAGTLFLAILNFVRVISLFLIGVYFPKAFLIMHLDVWQALFIFFAIVFWILWLRWATQNQIPAQQVLS
jgi:exosortase H (IPTLxxWG-CTERM-specific)